MLKKTAILLLAGSFMSACTTSNPYTGEQQYSKTMIGTGLGAAAGAIGGLFVGGSSRAQRNAVLIGAGIGALGGGLAGNYMDRQEAELRAQLQGTGVSVTRNGDMITLNMPGNVTFDTDKDIVKPAFYSVLNSVAIVLRKYNQSLVDVNGYTDSTGSDAHNLDLSKRRALSVAKFLNQGGIDGRRLSIVGYGKSNPIASNTSSAGRERNRRVEVQIAPLRSNGY